MMFSRIWLLNILTAAVALLCAVLAVIIWSRPVFLPSGGAAPPVEISRFAAPELQRPLPSKSVFGVIGERNLFSPDRRPPTVVENKPAPVKAAEVRDIKIDGRRISLYGVVMAPNRRQALISSPEPDRTPRDQVWVKEGEKVGNMTVARIHPAGMILDDGGSRVEIPLYDQDKERHVPSKEDGKNRNAVPSPPPRQTNTRATGKTAAWSLPGSGGKTQKTDSPPVSVTSPAPSDPPDAEAASSIEGDGAGEQFEIIKTPFGTIKRRKK